MRSRAGSVPYTNASSHAVRVGAESEWTSTGAAMPGMPGHVVEYVQSYGLVEDTGCVVVVDRARCLDSPHFLAYAT